MKVFLGVEPMSKQSAYAKKKRENGYATVRLPEDLIKEVDDLVGARILGFRSRADLIVYAIRQFLERYKSYYVDQAFIHRLEGLLANPAVKEKLRDILKNI